MSLPRGELARKLVHIGCVAFAFLLRYMSAGQAAAMASAAFLFNWQVLPRVGGKGLWRGLAVGDGMASLVGQAVGGPRLPWNERKGWAGLVAFVLFGTAAAAVLIAWTARLPLDPGSWHAGRTVGLAFCVSLACGLVESIPTTLDDNLTVPLAGAVLFPLFAQADPWILATDPDLVRRVALGLVLNGAIALVAWRARSIDGPGALSAIVIGTAITAGLGLPALALMVTFFVVGTAATRLGYRIKAARGIAQERGGARGWRHAWANGGVPALLALDRKSTRLNSSHMSISYAVFCLKKKTNNIYVPLISNKKTKKI